MEEEDAKSDQKKRTNTAAEKEIEQIRRDVDTELALMDAA